MSGAPASDRRRLVIESLVTFGALAGVLSAFARFVAGIETRPGVVLADPLLARIHPIDLTWPIFGALYGAIVVAVALLVRRPNRLLAGAQTYALVVLVRFAMMGSAPFDPPPDALPLVDPLVALFGPPAIMTRDLFFSGHTATATVLALTAPTRRARLGFTVAAGVIAVGVLWQKVHYTIDVLVAPLVAFAAWRAVLALRARLGLPDVGD